MRVKVIASDRGGCGYYRMIWPCEAVAAIGHDAKVIKFPQLVTDGQTVFGLSQSLDADVVVFQRPARVQYLEVIRYLQSQGIRVVIDMDDDLAEIHPANAAFIPYQQQDMNWRYCVEACRMADLVTCATDALAASYGNGSNSVVLSNCIPERYLDTEPQRDPAFLTIGWAGLVATHPTDLKITHGAVNQAIAKKDGVRFLALGDERTLFELGVRERAPNGWLPGVPIERYIEFVSQLNIGLVPLADTKFNRAKSWLKALEYASVGVAPVVSPTPDNLRMVEAGAALSAATPAEWMDKIRFLIDNQQERENLSKRALEFARQNTIEGNASKWWEAWTA